MNFITRRLTQIKFGAKERSPEICFVAGVGTLAAAGVMLWKARPKYEKVREELEKQKGEIKELTEKVEAGEVSEETYSKDDARNDILKVTVKAGAKEARILAPAIALGGLSIFLFYTSHKIMKGRYTGMAKAYEGIAKDYDILKNAVIATFGIGKYNELARVNTVCKILEPNEDSNDVSSYDAVEPMETYSANSKIFGPETSPLASKDPSANLFLLEGLQQTFTDLLRNRMTDSKPGRLFLNEVLRGLELEETDEGNLLGWTCYPNEEDNIKYGAQGYVDFGIYDISSDADRRFIEGYENTILLHFNVDKTSLLGRCGMPRR